MLLAKFECGGDYEKIGGFDSRLDLETKGIFGQLIDCANDLLEHDAKEVSFEFRRTNIIRFPKKDERDRLYSNP